MSKELTKTTNAALAAPTEMYGLDEIDSSDLVIPRLSIVQPTSATLKDAGGREGTFYSNLTGESVESMRIVPLKVGKGRVYFKSIESKEPDCKSDNGWLPSQRIESPVSPRCCQPSQAPGGKRVPVCRLAEWGSKGEPPPCSETYTLLATTEDGLPFFITLKSTAYQPARQLITFYAARRVSMFSHSCVVSLKKTKNSRGTFYVPTFSEFKPVEPADKYMELFKRVASYDTQRTYDAEKAADDEAAPF